jgi:hypothetical protein
MSHKIDNRIPLPTANLVGRKVELAVLDRAFANSDAAIFAVIAGGGEVGVDLGVVAGIEAGLRGRGFLGGRFIVRVRIKRLILRLRFFMWRCRFLVIKGRCRLMKLRRRSCWLSVYVTS